LKVILIFFSSDYKLRDIENTIPKDIHFTFVSESCHNAGLMEGSHEFIGNSLINNKKKKKSESSSKVKRNESREMRAALK